MADTIKKIGLHGSYFGRNFGDTLILHIIKNWIEEYSKDTKINLPRVKSKKEAQEILNAENLNVNIAELDGMIFGPGGYFGEQPGSFLRRLKWSIRNYNRHIRWNNKLFRSNVPYIIVGVGVGPLSFRFIRKGVVKLFKNADFVSVRDKYSKQYLIEWGIDPEKITIVPDVALTLQPENRTQNKIAKIALHYPNDNLVNSGKLNEFVQFIRTIQDSNEIYLLEDSEGQYLNNNKNNIKNILGDHGIVLPLIQYEGPKKLIKNLQNVDGIITTKLHVGIVGYSLGKKVLSIPNHTKTVRFYEQINREKFCIPLKKIDTGMLVDKFEQLNSMDSNNILFDDALKNKKIVFQFLGTI